MTTELATKPNALATIAQQSDVSAEIALPIINAFLPYLEAAERGEAVAKEITVTTADDIDGMQLAHDTRIKLSKVRTGADKVRKQHKDAYLRVGNCIQGAYNYIAAICSVQEDRLQASEDFARLAQEKRKAELKADREAELTPYLGVQLIHYDLANMPAKAYADLLTGSRLAHEARIAEAKRMAAEEEAAELARAQAARLAAEEAAKVRKENERLKAERADEMIAFEKKITAACEAAAQEKRKSIEAARLTAVKAEAQRKAAIESADKERNAVLEKARVEREAAAKVARLEREKLQAELDKASAEKVRLRNEGIAEGCRKIQAAEEANRAAQAAPDNAKLLALAASIRAVPIPACTGAAARALVEKVRANFVLVVMKLEEVAK